MSEKQRVGYLLGAVAGLVLLVLVIWSAAAIPVRAAPGVQCVNGTASGCDADCDGCYDTVQRAIDHAGTGDEIRVAGGAYTMTAGTVANIDKELWITGGYDPACGTFDADLYPTVLDGQGLGPVVVIVGTGDVGLMHLNITDGNATGFCGADGCGGGIYVESSILHMGHCILSHNVGNSGTGDGRGGGLYAIDSPVEVWESHFVSNTAQIDPAGGKGYGAGIYVEGGAASLRQNVLLDNLASVLDSGWGAGICLRHVENSDVLGNVLEGNRGNPPASNYSSYGGGLHIYSSHIVTVAGNTIAGNYTNGTGGGIGIHSSAVNVDSNRIMGNIAVVGGGIRIDTISSVTLTNNLIANNEASYKGGGLGVSSQNAGECRVSLYTNTIADNVTTAIATQDYATLTMTNNILSGHEIGIDETDPPSSTIVADTNLFNNDLDPVLGANPIEEDPLFGPEYQLQSGSPAIDAGLDLPWITVDLDGNPRPVNMAWDLGAFEGARQQVYLPIVLRSYLPAQTLIFDDDFEDGTLTGWTPHLGSWANPGDHMRGKYNLGNAWNIRSSTGGNIIYEGTVKLLSGNAVGLVFRSSANGTSSYDVILDAYDNVFKISKRPPYTILDSVAMPVQRNHAYKIKVVANGSTIQAYLDGVHLLTATDSTYNSGNLGVMLFRSDATYDDLKAWATP